MKKLELDEQGRKEHDAELNRQRVNRYAKTIDTVNVKMPKGTKDRIKNLGLVTNSWIRELVLKELDRLEGK